MKSPRDIETVFRELTDIALAMNEDPKVAMGQAHRDILSACVAMGWVLDVQVPEHLTNDLIEVMDELLRMSIEHELN